MKKALIIFTRIPEPGKTKTRMMPRLTPAQCAKLHTCFLKDIFRECKKISADIFVSYSPEGNLLRLKQIFGRQRYIPQDGESLGERMYHAISLVLGNGYDACLLIGTDVPEISCGCLKKAFEVLENKEVVFGKTTDGGYYLVGMKKPYRAAFALDSYGHGKVLKETIQDLQREKITVGYTETLADMDTVSDLQGYRERMRKDPKKKRSSTGKYLAKISWISVIVPVYNEAGTIDSMVRQLETLRGKCEILLVDGGSTDGTLERIPAWIEVLKSPKGRAFQMNLGAEKSTGDILFFLHCDSELPSHPLARIRKVMRDYRAGCFGIAFHSCHFFMFTCRIISNHRVKDRKVMFGDQGIFIDRELFFEAGGFPEIPIMEDYQFSLTLKKMHVKLGMADRRIYTSDRRFPKGTVPKLKLMWKMNRLRKMYRDGVPAERLAEMYRDVR